MILAADVGGSKTLVGLFAPDRPRPSRIHVEATRTLDFDGLPALLTWYLSRHAGVTISRVALGVAGPIVDDEATMTNVPWRVRAGDVAAVTGARQVRLLNDLEAMAFAVPVLAADELHTLRAGQPHPTGNAALIAAGTGLGAAVLHRVDGRFVPVASETGHSDFAVRTDDELGLFRLLRQRFGRVEIEHVVSGPGMVRIAEYTHGTTACATAGAFAADDDGAARVSAAGLDGACRHCARAVAMFVAAYGAEAGNLALRAVATAGVYVGGGIAPKLLPAFAGDAFLGPFTAKAPMADLLAAVPVHVILNDAAGLVGAAVAAAGD
ncbi:MAG: glucokinase [Vicinamibacterales bacterium]